jgi:release factor glutamine methyltransferase
MTTFRTLYERRLNREPVQYIVGTAGFMGLQFAVDGRVLIPRPETESLVEQAMLVCSRLDRVGPINIIEIGTGSGNIAVALAKFVRNSQVTSIDVSVEALEVARQNAASHGVEARISFQHIDVFEPVDQLVLQRFGVLVSNPPYIPGKEWDSLQQEVRKFEPRVALIDRKDGFEFHQRIVELAPFLLRDKGVVLLEVGSGQSDRVAEMMGAAGFFDISVVPDLQKIPRVVLGSCHSKTRNSGFVN